VPRRRHFTVFSMAFLDVMSCGFGAVILVYLVLNSTPRGDAEATNRDLLAELRLLDYQVQQGERDRIALQERIKDINERVEKADSRLAVTRRNIDRRSKDSTEQDAETIARRESLEQLKSDVETRQKEVDRLLAMEAATAGGAIRSFAGEGDRQYLTGMKVGGKHVVIAVDSSASMLDDTIVNVLRRRNMPADKRLQAPKWQRAIRTAEWLSAQLPLDASFQLIGFNTTALSLLPDGDGRWVPLGEGRELDAGMNRLRATVPDGGTSLANLISAISQLNPPPDNVYLIIDSLPTQGPQPPRGATIDARERLKLFGDAIAKLPARVPVNVILFPMEGDPMAAAAYWNLARTSGGSFISPSRDWP
jgi:hypothetical protein